MIQPISHSNTNFRGQVQVSMKNDKNKGIDEILSKLPEGEEREMLQDAVDSFKKQVEEKTPDDASIALEMEYGDWYAGGSLKSGKSVTFEVRDLKNSDAPLFKREVAITRKDGTLWETGDDFGTKFTKFFNAAARKTINTFNFRRAVEDSHKPKSKPKNSILDQMS